MQTIKDRKRLSMVIAGLIAGVAAIVAGSIVTSKLPEIIIEPGQDNTGGAKSDIYGHISYDMRIRYEDGSVENYGKNIQAPAFKFSLLSLYTDQSKSKEIVGIDIMAKSELDMPADQVLTGVASAVPVTSKIDVLLNTTTITSKTFDNTFTLEELRDPQDLYTVTIVPSQIVKLLQSDGTYVLSFKIRDEFKFTVNGQPKILTVAATPSLYYQGLKPAYAVIVEPALNVKLDRLPSTTWDGEVVGYWNYIIVTATGFKANSDLLFDYSKGGESIVQASDKTIRSNAQGSASDKVQIGSGSPSFSMPRCYQYYTLLTVSDGTNTADIKIGCASRNDPNPGVTF